jgi:hypothetical protein
MITAKSARFTAIAEMIKSPQRIGRSIQRAKVTKSGCRTSRKTHYADERMPLGQQLGSVLTDLQDVPVRVLEPRSARSAGVLGDSVHGLHTGKVVFLEDNATTF